MVEIFAGNASDASCVRVLLFKVCGAEQLAVVYICPQSEARVD